jgi:tetratricopeptide (TPR) repeat protein
MVTICLNMIVKNEGKIIRRLLDSVYKLLDYWVIVDTGSTDDTKEIIKEYFAEKNIPGELHEKEFVNFGVNRTHALKLAKNKADYLFFMDADHIIKYDNTFSKEQLKNFDEINIQLKTGTLKYYLIRFLKADMDIKSVGVTHEYYAYDRKNPKIANFKNIWIDDYGDGGCRHVKFERDIKLLTESVKNNKKNARDLFYLGESYRHTRNYEKAIECYEKRANIDNFPEEKWFSTYMVGRCYLILKNEKEAIHWCLKAYNYRPTRSEPLYVLAEYYAKQKKYQISDIFCEIGSKIHYPHNDVLFIEEDIYRFKFTYVKAMIYYHLNKNISKELSNAILKQNIADKFFYNMLNNVLNYKYSLINKLNLNITSYHQIFNKVNNSICKTNNEYYIINSISPIIFNKMNINTGKLLPYKIYTKYNLFFCKICTNCIKIDDIFVLVIYHKYDKNKLHKFVCFDNELNIICITDSFYLKKFSDERIFDIQYDGTDLISIFWSKENSSAYKTTINKEQFKNYLFQFKNN